MDGKPNNIKPKSDKNPRGKYEEKLKIKGSFLGIVKASIKDANAKTSKKKKMREE